MVWASTVAFFFLVTVPHTTAGPDLLPLASHEACDREASDSSNLMQTRVGVALPHDKDVDECDRTKPIPPHIGIWTDRYNPPKDPKVIVEIGGNVGGDANNFLKMHPNARIYTFEPIPQLFEGLQKRFAYNHNVIVRNIGVSNSNGEDNFISNGANGEGASGEDHSISGKRVKGQLRDVDEVLSWVQKETGHAPDLLSMNCEGCEYKVMQRMGEKGWLAKVPFVQLSWHPAGDVKDRVKKRCGVEKLLWQTHTRAFKSDFGWVGWELAQR